MKGEREADTSRRLTVEDFKNPFFDRQKIVVRTIDHGAAVRKQMVDELADDLDPESYPQGGGRKDLILRDVAEEMLSDEPEFASPKKERVIEGTTYTDNFNLVGFTYSLENSSIQIVNTDNVVLFKGFIYSAEEYEKALKKADKKQRKLDFG